MPLPGQLFIDCIDPSNFRISLWTWSGYANSHVEGEWCTAWAAFPAHRRTIDSP